MDYIDIYIPFIATLISQRKYGKIGISQVIRDLKQEFGLVVPYHAMVTVLNRAREKGLIKRNSQRVYVPIKDTTLYRYA